MNALLLWLRCGAPLAALVLLPSCDGIAGIQDKHADETAKGASADASSPEQFLVSANFFGGGGVRVETLDNTAYCEGNVLAATACSLTVGRNQSVKATAVPHDGSTVAWTGCDTATRISCTKTDLTAPAKLTWYANPPKLTFAFDNNLFSTPYSAVAQTGSVGFENAKRGLGVRINANIAPLSVAPGFSPTLLGFWFRIVDGSSSGIQLLGNADGAFKVSLTGGASDTLVACTVNDCVRAPLIERFALHHLTVAFEGARIAVSLDGQPIGHTAAARAGATLTFGGVGSVPTLVGLVIDELRLYEESTPFTDEEKCGTVMDGVWVEGHCVLP